MTQLVIEKKALLETFGNDAEFLKTVIGIFLADCAGMLTAIRAGVAAQDYQELMNTAHALKGSVSVFGAIKAVEAVRVLESMSGQKQLEGVAEALRVLEHEIALVCSALEEIAKETA
jgi:HPt (histidine-containing phosphotransfer) domain-containing protein